MKLKLIFPFLAASICLTSCERVTAQSFDFKKYEEYRAKIGSAYGTAEGLLPPISELGEYERVQFAYKQFTYLFFLDFKSEGISLFLDYSQENYALAKSYVEETYTFIDDEYVEAHHHYQFPVASFEYKEYSFRIAPTPHTNSSTEEIYYMCKSFVMIGYNESINSVAYLYFYDFDLDYLYDEDDKSAGDINAVMPELIKKSFYWRKK